MSSGIGTRGVGELTGHRLKLIAIAAMFVDHIAWAFVENPLLSLFLHTVGRITAPIMCFFIARGYQHTRSLSRYLARLLVFAAASQIPFALFAVGRPVLFPLNVLYTLALGLLAIYSYDKIEHKGLRLLTLGIIMILALPGDWGAFGVALCLLFHILRDQPAEQAQALLVIALALFVPELVLPRPFWLSFYHFGILLSLPLLHAYNGQRGGSKGSRWLFYIFYPAHLALLALLQRLF